MERKMFVLMVLMCVAALGVRVSANPVTIFYADFEGSVPIDETTGVVANADVENLNNGTAMGQWSWSGAAFADNRGAIISSPSGSDNAFTFDNVISGGANRRATGLFTETVDIGAGDTMSFAFDIYPSRQGDGRQIRLALTDSGGTSAGSRAYVLIFDIPGEKEFRWLDTENSLNAIGSQTGIGFHQPEVDSYRDWNWADGGMIRAKIDVLGQTTVEGDAGAFVSIDWNNNGIWDVESLSIGPRDIGVSAIDRFELFYGGSGNRGVYLDNIVASYTPIPEPGTLLLLGMGGLTLLGRRR